MLACHHHVFERILSAVHKQLFGPSSTPDNTYFTHFRNSIWPHINTEQGFRTLHFKEHWLKTRRDHAISYLKRILSSPGRKGTLPRTIIVNARNSCSFFRENHLSYVFTGCVPAPLIMHDGCLPFCTQLRCLPSVSSQDMTGR